jgi:hypothetical protein
MRREKIRCWYCGRCIHGPKWVCFCERQAALDVLRAQLRELIENVAVADSVSPPGAPEKP